MNSIKKLRRWSSASKEDEETLKAAKQPAAMSYTSMQQLERSKRPQSYHSSSSTTRSRSGSQRVGSFSSGSSRTRGGKNSSTDVDYSSAWQEEVVVRAKWSFNGEEPYDLSFRKGDFITVITQTESKFDWWEGRCQDRTGIFPANYVV